MTVGMIFYQRRWFLAGVFILLLAAFSMRVFLFPVYEAQTVLMVDKKAGPTTTESQWMDANQLVGLIRMHSYLMTEPDVLERVLAVLHLDDHPSKDTQRQTLIEGLKRRITITSPVFTNLLEVSVRAPDPREAAQIANTLVDEYRQWYITFSLEEAHEVVSYLDREVELSKKELETAERALKQFKQAQNIANLSEQTKVSIQHQAQMAADLASVTVEEQQVMARLHTLEEQLQTSKESTEQSTELMPSFGLSATHNPTIQNFEKELLALEIELGRLRELYLDTSPQVVWMTERVDELKVRMRSAIEEALRSDVGLASLNPLYEDLVTQTLDQRAHRVALRARKKALEHLTVDDQGYLQSVPEKEFELTRLVRNVRVHEERFKTLKKEQEKAHLIHTKQSTENLRVISKAIPPLHPQGRLRGLIESVIVALFVSCGLVVLLNWKKVFRAA